jgi:hypothetical protein
MSPFYYIYSNNQCPVFGKKYHIKVLVTHEIIEDLLTDEVSDEGDGEFLTFNKTKDLLDR